MFSLHFQIIFITKVDIYPLKKAVKIKIVKNIVLFSNSFIKNGFLNKEIVNKVRKKQNFIFYKILH